MKKGGNEWVDAMMGDTLKDVPAEAHPGALEALYDMLDDMEQRQQEKDWEGWDFNGLRARVKKRIDAAARYEDE